MKTLNMMQTMSDKIIQLSKAALVAENEYKETNTRIGNEIFTLLNDKAAELCDKIVELCNKNYNKEMLMNNNLPNARAEYDGQALTALSVDMSSHLNRTCLFFRLEPVNTDMNNAALGFHLTFRHDADALEFSLDKDEISMTGGMSRITTLEDINNETNFRVDQFMAADFIAYYLADSKSKLNDSIKSMITELLNKKKELKQITNNAFAEAKNSKLALEEQFKSELNNAGAIASVERVIDRSLNEVQLMEYEICVEHNTQEVNVILKPAVISTNLRGKQVVSIETEKVVRKGASIYDLRNLAQKAIKPTKEQLVDVDFDSMETIHIEMI
jgi:hypothetical protein